MEQAWVAEQLGVTERTVRRWASSNNEVPVPFGVEDWLRGWWEKFGALHEAAVEGALEMQDEHGEVAVVDLARYASRGSIERAGVDMPVSMHSALVGLIAFGLSGEGLDFQVGWVKMED